VAQVVEHLPSRCEALSLNLYHENKKLSKPCLRMATLQMSIMEHYLSV
jgi:hypothetical protein